VDLTVVYDDGVLGDGSRERSVEGRDVALHCELRAYGDLLPLCDLYTGDALPDASASVAAEVVVSTHRRVTELLRGRYVRSTPRFDALRARLDPARVDALSSAAAATIGSLSVRDAAGAARSGDWLTAAAAAEMALEYALDAALLAAGDPYRSRKFLPRRLARVEALAPCLDDVRRLAALPAGDDAALERRTRETLLVANGLQAATLLKAGRVWTAGDRGDGPRRSPYVTLVATDAMLRLAGAQECALLRPAAVLWLLADGRPEAELARRFAELTGLGADDVTSFVATTLAGLADAGAVEAA
jgi:hypothetical protein